MPLPAYPCAPGNKPWSSHSITGPASYVQVVVGSPLGSSSGGQLVPATAFGLQSFEGAVVESGSGDGQYFGQCFLAPYPTSGAPLPPNIIVRWIVAATGAEVSAATNLSTFRLRIRAVGL